MEAGTAQDPVIGRDVDTSVHFLTRSRQLLLQASFIDGLSQAREFIDCLLRFIMRAKMIGFGTLLIVCSLSSAFGSSMTAPNYEVVDTVSEPPPGWVEVCDGSERFADYV